MASDVTWASDRLTAGIERLPLHTHACVIYETAEQQFAAVLPFIRTGLVRGEKCLCIVDEHTPDEIAALLQSDGIDVAAHRQSGALAIVRSDEAYLQDGRFDPDRMMALLKTTCEAAVAAGFPGLRATGGMTWTLRGAPGTERFAEYEARVNGLFPQLPFSALCLYNRAKCPPDMIRHALRTHPVVITGGRVCRNPAYVPPAELLDPAHEVDRLLDSILQYAARAEEVDRALSELQLRTQRQARELAAVQDAMDAKAEECREASASLQMLSGRVQGFLDTLADLAWEVDASGIVWFVSEGAKDVTGYTPEEVIGHHILDFAPPELVDSFRPRLEAALGSVVPMRDLEVPVLTRDGRRLSLLVRGTPIQDERGVLAGHRGVLTDVTPLRESQESLRRLNTLLASISEAQSVFIAEEDATATYEKLLDTLVRLTGSEVGFLSEVFFDQAGQPGHALALAITEPLPAGGLDGQPVSFRNRRIEFRNLDNLAGQAALTGQVTISNDPADNAGARGFPPGHPPVRTFMGIPLFFGGELVGLAGVANRPGGYDAALAESLRPFLNTCAGIMHAVRARQKKRESELELARSERQYRQIVDTASEGIWAMDENHVTTFVNARMAEMLGYRIDEIIGRHVECFMVEQDLIAHAERMRRRHAGMSERYERRFRRKDGSELWTHVSSTALMDERGGFCGSFAMFVDITEQKHAEQEAQLTIELLRLLNTSGDVPTLTSRLTLFLRERFDVEAVGLRLKDDRGDFPYHETRGFPAEFVRAENRLCTIDPDGKPELDPFGNPVLACMCGNVICGRFDPTLPFFTTHGSFWTNSTSELLATASEADRQARTRNRCHGEGYESVALFPLRAGGAPLGLMQLNDRRKGRFATRTIALLERLAGNISIALAEKLAEQALGHRTRELDAVFEALPDLYFRVRQDGTILDYRAGRTSDLYIAPELFVGRTMQSVLPPEVAEQMGEAISKTTRTREATTVEYPLAVPAGAKHFEARMMPLNEDELIILVRDITERRQHEESLRQRGQELILTDQVSRIALGIDDVKTAYQLIVDAIAAATGFPIVAIESYDAAQEEMVFLGARGVPGSSPEQPLRIPVDETLSGRVARTQQPIAESRASLHPDYRNEALRALHVDTFVCVPMIIGGQTIGVLSLADPAPRELSPHFVPWMSDLAAHVASLTRRTKAEHELRQSEETLRLTLEATQDGLWDWNITTGEVRRNRRFHEMLGYEPDSLLGTFDGWLGLVHPDDRASSTMRIQKHLAGEDENYEAEFRMQARSGEWRWILSRGKVVTRGADGRPLRMLGTHTDVTDRKRTEAALRESEARFRLLVESAPDPLFVQTDWKFAYVNPAAVRAFGADSAGQLLGTPVLDRFHPNFRDIVCERIRCLNEGRRAVPGREESCLRLDGTSFDVEVSAAPLVYEGRPGAVVFARDITERRRAEQRIRLQAMVLDQIGDHVTITDMAGRITYVNAAQARQLGHRTEELIGQSVEFYGEDPASGVTQHEIIERTRTEGHWEGEVVNRHRDGSRVITACRTWVIHDEGGDPIAMCGISQDITERVLMDLQRRRLETAIEQAGDAVVIADLDGTIQYVNAGFERITGYSRAEAVGRKPSLLRSGEHDEAFYRDLWATIADGRIWEGRFINRRKDGSLYHEQATISPVRGHQDGLAGFVAVKRDVTEEDRLENQLQQIQRMDALGQMAASVAHDFSNLLAVIRANNELAMDLLKAHHPAMPHLEASRQTVERASDITRSMLTFSRGEEVEKHPILVSTLVDDACRLIRLALPRQVQLESRLECCGLRRIQGNPTQLQQVLLNLALNARDAMPQGGVLRVTAECACTTPDSPHADALMIAVTDTGCGMAPEIKQRIFDPFFTTKSRGEGTGLGLSIVHGIISDHGGHIHVESDVGQGTTFHLILPLTDAADESPEGRDPSNAAPGRGERLLVAVGDPYLGGMIKSSLRTAGYEVTSARTCDAAWEAVQTRKADFRLVVADANLRDHGGVRLLGRLLAARTGLPVIALAGTGENDESETPDQAVRMPGAFSMSALVATIADTLAAGVQEEPK